MPHYSKAVCLYYRVDTPYNKIMTIYSSLSITTKLKGANEHVVILE